MMLQNALLLLVAAASTATISGFTVTPAPPLAFSPHTSTQSTPTMTKATTTTTRLSMSDPASAESTLSIDDITGTLLGHETDFSTKMGAATTVSEAEAIRVEYLGKKGPINKVMSSMRLLANEDKPKLGQVVNAVKSKLEAAVDVRKEELEILEIELQMENEKVDVTLPGISSLGSTGHRHPLSTTMEKAVDIFVKLGYDTVTDCEESPEIESDYMCFEALNCPKDHPARDMQDTFYLTEDLGKMLRTHTSAVQIRQLGKRTPPLRIVAPGRVYRKDDIDATHSMIFHQIEILALDERGKLNLGHLKGTVEHFLKNMLGPNIEVRFRGSYFPFTEPSMEVDVYFNGKWLEVLGCGMVDPNVLEMAGLDPQKVSGFAAGFGVERFAMVIHEINDIREFYNNDRRFLNQFPHFHDQGLMSMLDGKMPVRPKSNTGEVNAMGEAVQAVEEKVKTEEDTSEKSKKKKKKAPPAAATATDISKLDMRVGVITKAWHHTEGDKLFCEEIDIGEETGPRQIASGLRAHYDVDDLVGQRVIVLANLKTRKLMGFPSHGMVMCAAQEEGDGGKVEFIEPPVGAKVGERIMVEGFDGEPATENQIVKKKMLDAIFPDLSTDSNGVATYKGVALSTSAGPCVAQNKLPNSPVG